MNLVTQFFMRVQLPPSRCRSDSLSPRPATGSPRSERGDTADPGSLTPGIPSSRHLWAAPAKGWRAIVKAHQRKRRTRWSQNGTGEGAGSLLY